MYICILFGRPHLQEKTEAITNYYSTLALSVDLAVAEFLIGTTRNVVRHIVAMPVCQGPEREREGRINLLYGLLPENNMPQELHDSPTLSIRLASIDNPLPDLDVIVARPRENLLPGHGKLRTASCPDKLGHTQVPLVPGVCWRRERLAGIEGRGAGAVEDLRPHLLGDVLVAAVACFAAWVPVAA